MRRRGLRERILYALNPYPQPPAGVIWSLRYFSELCGLRGVREAPTQSHFRLQWMYGTGADSELVVLAEGEMQEFRESEAKEFYRERQELGFVLLDDPSDEAQVRDRKLEGIARAIEFYGSGMRGSDKLIELQATHSFTDQQMQQQARQHWIYYVNAKIEEFLIAYRDSDVSEDFGTQWIAAQAKLKPKAIRAA